ncbi:hypothetical protein [Carnobacterium mobile]|uniref:hypothetical protein n=1 Tax=Carnobacterium mobile TaxID=2750 RepID=UPI0005551F61|nr:hypothetical protein [Carnobacterium mobile]
MKQRLNERLKLLEYKTSRNDSRPLFIDIIEDGIVEIYSEIDGKKERMSEEEYARWSKQFLQSKEIANFELNLGRWENG